MLKKKSKKTKTTNKKTFGVSRREIFWCHKIIHRSAEQMLTITKRTEAGLWSASKLHFTWVDQGSRQQLFPVSTLGVSDSSFCGLSPSYITQSHFCEALLLPLLRAEWPWKAHGSVWWGLPGGTNCELQALWIFVLLCWMLASFS